MLSEILNIKRGLTAIIGSGGKTTLMYRLADELSQRGRVIVCTSTKIFMPDNIITLVNVSKKDLCFEKRNILCVGEKCGNGKLTKPLLSFRELNECADYVLCEADGSKGLPLKAHEGHEPVIPKEAVDVIQVLGINGMGHKIKDVCHRPEIYAALAGCSVSDVVTPERAARVIRAESLGNRLIINQVGNNMNEAEKIAEYLNIPVYAGEIRKGELKCLHL